MTVHDPLGETSQTAAEYQKPTSQQPCDKAGVRESLIGQMIGGLVESSSGRSQPCCPLIPVGINPYWPAGVTAQSASTTHQALASGVRPLMPCQLCKSGPAQAGTVGAGGGVYPKGVSRTGAPSSAKGSDLPRGTAQ